LKRDVAEVGRLDIGVWLYRYRYLWSVPACVGMMPRAVAAIVTEAVACVADG
jgi:hypothetical protein